MGAAFIGPALELFGGAAAAEGGVAAAGVAGGEAAGAGGLSRAGGLLNAVSGGGEGGAGDSLNPSQFLKGGSLIDKATGGVNALNGLVDGLMGTTATGNGKV